MFLHGGGPLAPLPTWADGGLLLAALAQGSEDAVMGKTLAGIIVWWNAGAERLFGYTAAEAIGQASRS